MTEPNRRWLLAVIAGVSLAGASATDEEGNWRRLNLTPRERRLQWSQKLEEFDSLGPGDQTLVRDLDRSVSSLAQADRANSFATLRRYHLWLKGLPEALRNEINSAPPDKRMAVVARIWTDPAKQVSATPVFVRLTDFGGVSPYELANRIKIWFALNPAQRMGLNRLEEPARLRTLKDHGSKLKIAAISPPPRLDEESVFQRAIKRNSFAALKRSDDLVMHFPKLKQRLADHIYFVDNPPVRVLPENLLLFTKAMPDWERVQFDALPPDEARRRITIIYRLVLPSPEEYRRQTVDSAPAPAAAPPPKSESPVNKPAATTSPY